MGLSVQRLGIFTFIGFFGGLLDKFVGSFSISFLLDIKGRGCWWVANVYGPTNPRIKNLLWEKLSYNHGVL